MSPGCACDVGRGTQGAVLRPRPTPGAAPGVMPPAGAAWSAAVGVLAMALYAWTLAPSVGWGDSADLALRMTDFGDSTFVDTPREYGFFRGIGLVFQLLPFGDAGTRANLMTAFFGALAVTAVAALTMLAVGSRVAGIASGLALTVSHTFWLLSVTAEVYTMTTALAYSVFFLSALSAVPDPGSDRIWCVGGAPSRGRNCSPRRGRGALHRSGTAVKSPDRHRHQPVPDMLVPSMVEGASGLDDRTRPLHLCLARLPWESVLHERPGSRRASLCSVRSLQLRRSVPGSDSSRSQTCQPGSPSLCDACDGVERRGCCRRYNRVHAGQVQRLCVGLSRYRRTRGGWAI